MPSVRIVLDPERAGLGLSTREVVSVEENIVISGLPDGTESGKPLMCVAFEHEGRTFLLQITWALFTHAHRVFSDIFGAAAREGVVTLEYDATGAGGIVQLDLSRDPDAPNDFRCELCGEEKHTPPGEEGAIELVQWVHRHYREKHSDA